MNDALKLIVAAVLSQAKVFVFVIDDPDGVGQLLSSKPRRYHHYLLPDLSYF